MDGHATSLLDRITTTMAGAGDHGDGDGHDEHVHDNDAGLACPRLLPACYAQKFSSKIPGLIEAGALGRLYKWAQQLAGLEYLSVQKPKHTQVRKRLLVYFKLQDQIGSLLGVFTVLFAFWGCSGALS